MARQQKTIEEQMAEALANRRRIEARMQVLQVRRRARDNRMRVKGESVLLRIVVDEMKSLPTFKKIISDAAAKSNLRPDEQEALSWFMNEIDHPGSSSETATTAQKLG